MMTGDEWRIQMMILTHEETDATHYNAALHKLEAHDAEQRAEITRLREALKSIVEGEGLWSASDMAHAAQQTLNELPCGDT